ETFGGLLLLIGLFTRPVAFVLSGEMAVAYFRFHAPQGFWPLLNDGEGAVLYCFIFLYLASTGGGPWSFDCLLRKPQRSSSFLPLRLETPITGSELSATLPLSDYGRVARNPGGIRRDSIGIEVNSHS